ncbi:disintegrin and metalloproteinase domain-containing protein 33-like [Carcharodon carcharias]|uniref:disintegrin and metalloproteinase domain-containing protein 33-like n=1 Tax=Carcharodon carcharias TaxID=13397 RepID=UPI001B7EE4D2|nr:disintegrin and metalloproteinase domain-containing protein 33-like [Carcharodon carcharias]
MARGCWRSSQELSQLFGSGYMETHYEEDGTRVTITPNYTEHCLYHGQVRGYQDSWLAVSLCSGLSGIVVVDTNDSYYLQPIRDRDSQHHIIYRTEHLPIRTGSCGHHLNSQSGIDMVNELVHQHLRVRVTSPGR